MLFLRAALGAVHVYEDKRTVALPCTGNLEHFVLRLDVTSAERHWFETKHPLYNFMFRTVHADIRLMPMAFQAFKLGEEMRAAA